jgi:tetratricopeptide (TPR) repeat protein
MSRPRFIALLLTLVTLLIYFPVTRDGFINYDDDDYITGNRIVENGLTYAGIKWAFTTFYESNWHPVTWLSHMTDCELFDLNAGAHHFVNALIHSVNVALLFALLLRLTGTPWPSALVAALFGWHPLHVESVAWIAERKDVLSTFFALLALLAYVKYARQKSRHSFCHALIFFALGLMSKPMLVTLPFVLLLLDFWPLQRLRFSPRFESANCFSLLFEKIPFFLLSAISCVVTFLAQGSAMDTLEVVPLPLRLENVVVSYVAYLSQIIWPADLAVCYPLPTEFASPAIAISCAGLGLITVLVWMARGRTVAPLMGWFWFLGTLVPVIGLVQVGAAARADRYTYFPSVGIFMAIVFGSWALLKQPRSQKRFIAAGFAVLAACVVLTENQLRYWQDSETLFRHAIAVTRDNDTAHLNLGAALEVQDKPSEALVEFYEAQRLAPWRFEICNDIANILYDDGKIPEALAEFQTAVRLKPEIPYLHNNVGNALVQLGRFDEAMQEYTNALKLDPNYSWTHFQLGNALLKQGRDTEALDQFHDALRLDPDNFQILAYLARVLAAEENPKLRDGQTALLYAFKANLLTGGTQPFVLDSLGMACAEVGRFDDAQEAMQRAVALTNTVKINNLNELRQRLELYQHQQPWRESFRATNAPAQP